MINAIIIISYSAIRHQTLIRYVKETSLCTYQYVSDVFRPAERPPGSALLQRSCPQIRQLITEGHYKLAISNTLAYLSLELMVFMFRAE